MREIRTLRAMRRELETEPRRVRFGHEGRYPGHSQGVPCGPPRQFPTLPGRCPRGPVTRVAGILSRRRTRQNAARAPRKLPLVEGVGTGCQPVPWAYSLSRVLREVRVPAGSLDLPGPGLTRGAAEESQTVSVRSAAPSGLGSTFPLIPGFEDSPGAGFCRPFGTGPQSIQHTCDLAKPKAPAGVPEYKPGVSPRTPGKACIAGQALNGRQTSCGQRRSGGGLQLFWSRLAAGTYQAQDLRRGAEKESQRVYVLNELRRSRGKGCPETSHPPS